MQIDFLTELFEKCHQNNIHTCLDTSGYGLGDYDEILKYTDLVLFDIKDITREGYKNVTYMDIDKSLEFLEAMKRNNTKMWIRHVVVPGLTDGEEHIKALNEYIKDIPNVEKVELLPYHLLGVNKYETMGIPYKLEGVEAMDKEVCEGYKKLIKLT